MGCAVIVAIDTSSALTSVAVVEGDAVLGHGSHLDARRHAEVIGPLLAEVLAGVDPESVQAVACGVGPGPYTGLRVGIAAALALGVAWGRPVHGLCSLDAIAAAACAAAPSAVPAAGLHVASDARRREVYWAGYDRDANRVAGPRVARPEQLDPELRAGAWAGHGAAEHPELFPAVLDAGYADAAWVGRRVQALLAAGAAQAHVDLPLDAHGEDSGRTSAALEGTALLAPRPLYLRRPDAAAPATVVGDGRHG
jgi:tRNA threonylcarbamoyl adenosine modification protein YeaZ